RHLLCCTCIRRAGRSPAPNRTGSMMRARTMMSVLLAVTLVATMSVTGALPIPEADAAGGGSLTATVTLKELNQPTIATIEVTPRYWEAGDSVTVTVTPTVGSMECLSGPARPV